MLPRLVCAPERSLCVHLSIRQGLFRTSCGVIRLFILFFSWSFSNIWRCFPGRAQRRVATTPKRRRWKVGKVLVHFHLLSMLLFNFEMTLLAKTTAPIEDGNQSLFFGGGGSNYKKVKNMRAISCNIQIFVWKKPKHLWYQCRGSCPWLGYISICVVSCLNGTSWHWHLIL